MRKTDRHEPLHWRATCPSPNATPEERWPPCGLDCESRSMCEREAADRNEELARRERAAGVATADQTEDGK